MSVAKTVKRPVAKKTAASGRAALDPVVFDRAREPKGSGGVRFEERNADQRPRVHYLVQEDDATLGHPQAIEISVRAI